MSHGTAATTGLAVSTGHAAEIAASGAQMTDAIIHFVGSVMNAAGDLAWVLIPVGVVLGATFCAGYFFCRRQMAVGAPVGRGDGEMPIVVDERWSSRRDATLDGLGSPRSEPDPESDFLPTNEELADWAASRRRAEEEESGDWHGTSWHEDEWESMLRHAESDSDTGGSAGSAGAARTGGLP